MNNASSMYSKEFMDFVNEKDEIIGKALQKDIYRKLLTYRIVHVLIFNDKGEMALQLRSKNKNFVPDHWSTSAGGHVQSGETYEQAALRECEEELGIKLKMQFLFKDAYDDKSRPGLKKFLGVFRTAYGGPFKINTKEVEKVEFFRLDEIQKMVDRGEKFHPEPLFLLEKPFGVK